MTVTSTNSSTSTTSTDASTRVPQKTLGQKDFLKLIAAQLANQDPMKPMDDTTFIAQMANFSSLEQMSQMRTSSDLSFARSLIGQEVTLRDPETQKVVTGEVSSVDVTDQGAAIVIGDTAYSLSTILSVTAPQKATTEATSDSTTEKASAAAAESTNTTSSESTETKAAA